MSNKVRLVVEFTSKEEMHAWVHEARAEGLLPHP